MRSIFLWAAPQETIVHKGSSDYGRNTMPSVDRPGYRRTTILHILAKDACTLKELRPRLDPVPSSRCLEKDIASLRRAFPGRLIAERRGREKVWQFAGDVPRVLESPIQALDEDQIAALIAARGLLRLPDPADTPAERAGTVYHGALAQALDRLLREGGLEDEAQAIAPDAIAISRFGVAPEEDAVFPLALAAIRCGESLHFRYTNLDGKTHAVHARALKLVHIAGEWHCYAWATDTKRPPGTIKQYRLSRMTDVARSVNPPPRCPVANLRRDVSALLRDAFRATGSADPARRRRIVVAVSPRAWPFLERRRWGADQIVDETPEDLPTGWRRLRFVTTGWEECRHWLLGFGAEIRAEGPPDLVAWLHSQAQAILANRVQTKSARGRTGMARRVRE